MKNIGSAICALLIFLGFSVQAQYTVAYDVEFLDPGRYDKMDIFVPNAANPGNRLPLIIIVHGGGLTGGDKRDFYPQCIHFASQGYIAATVNYALAMGSRGEPGIPRFLWDIKESIRFLKAKASTYFIDTNRVGLYGVSSGGTLVRMAAYTDHNDVWLNGTGELPNYFFVSHCDDYYGTRYPGHSSKVQAVASENFAVSNEEVYLSPDDPPTMGVNQGPGLLPYIYQLRQMGVPAYQANIAINPHAPADNTPTFDSIQNQNSTLMGYFTSFFNLFLKNPARVNAPEALPNGGEFTQNVLVTFISPQAGSSIFYTTDGTNPTPSSTLYTGPVLLSETTTLKAISRIGSVVSNIKTCEFQKKGGKYMPPVKIVEEVLPPATLGQPYSYTLTAHQYQGGSLNWYVNNAVLPPGITFNRATATFSGTPTTRVRKVLPGKTDSTGHFPFVVVAGIGQAGGSTIPSITSNDVYCKSYTLEVSRSALPSAPLNLSASVQSQNKIALAWGDGSSIEQKAIIERKEGNGNFTVIDSTLTNITTYLDQAVNQGIVYQYRVRYKNASGFSPYSNVAEIVFDVPDAPSQLLGTAETGNRVFLQWSDCKTEDSFVISRKTGNGSFVFLDTIAVNQIIYEDPTVSTGFSYTYRVFARNAFGLSASSPEVTVLPLFQVDPPKFSVPGGVYSSNKILVLSTDTLGSKIFYTTNGSNPDSSTAIRYTGPVLISQSATVKAKAYKPRLKESRIATATYTILPGEESSGAISLNFVGQAGGSDNLSPSDSGGVVRLPNWNNIVYSNVAKVVPLVGKDGGTTTAQFIFRTNDFQQRTISNATNLSRGTEGKINYTGFNNYSASSTYRIRGIPFEKYDVYVLWAAGQSGKRNGIISCRITGNGVKPNERYFILNKDDVLDQPYKRATATVVADTVSGNNYALWKNVTGDSLSVLVNRLQNTEAMIYAIQIVEQGSRVSKPNISPTGGVFQDSVQVTMDIDTVGARIFYTTNGVVPDTLSTLYTGPFKLFSSASVFARAFKQGLIPSAVAVANFTVNSIPQVQSPVTHPDPGTYAGSVTLDMVAGIGDEKVYYTTDGTDPDTSSTLYVTPITITSTTVFKMRAYKAGYLPSQVVTATFVITPVAVSEAIPGAPFTVFPNPVSDELFVAGGELAGLDLYTLQGAFVTSSTDRKLSFSTLPPGVYWLKIRTADGRSAIHQLMKNR